jgi:MscS family membrane protein
VQTFMTEVREAINAYEVGDVDVLLERANRAYRTMNMPYPSTDVERIRRAEQAIALFEVLIRIDVPEPEASSSSNADQPSFWTIPQTEITLERIESETGEFIGYRFTADTVARALEFRERIKHLPPFAEYRAYRNYYETFLRRPGLDAPAFFIEFVHDLPAPAFTEVGGQPLWKWLTLIIATVLAVLLFFGSYRIANNLEQQSNSHSLSALWAKPLILLTVIGIVSLLQFIVVDILRMTGVQRGTVVTTLRIIGYAAAIWLLFLISSRVVNLVIHIRDMGVHGLDSQLARLIAKVLAVIGSLFLIIHLAETLGIPVAPVLAGLGVGGLAVALAVRPTLENIVAGFVLFADKPVRVGEFCAFSDKLGTVENVGLRSVQVRGLDRTVITIPNAEFCQLQIINFSRRDSNLMHTTLGLRYETTADQLRLVLTRLRELLIRHPKVSMDPARVRFLGYGDYALNIEVFAFIQTREWGEFLAIQEDINLRIKDIVAAAGTDFAFPSQTVYMERGHGLDPEAAAKAESQVERWREENRLPFPEHEEGFRFELSGTLDYPPEGSAGNKRHRPDTSSSDS